MVRVLGASVMAGRVQFYTTKLCPSCGVAREVLCYSVGYGKTSGEPFEILRTQHYSCPVCATQFEERIPVKPPTEKEKLIRRLLRLCENFNCLTSLDVHDNRLVFTVALYRR